jgi:hypothetical protein
MEERELDAVSCWLLLALSVPQAVTLGVLDISRIKRLSEKEQHLCFPHARLRGRAKPKRRDWLDRPDMTAVPAAATV